MSSFGDDIPGADIPGADIPGADILGAETLTLIRTKLQRPRLGQDLIPRPYLIERLNRGPERKLSLISAQAGAGKTTLLAQWLEGCHQASAWLSLDEHDNDLMVFVSYLCGAIRTVFPDACEQALALLNAPRNTRSRHRPITNYSAGIECSQLVPDSSRPRRVVVPVPPLVSRLAAAPAAKPAQCRTHHGPPQPRQPLV